MRSLDKFHAVINFDRKATVTYWEFAYWYDTLTRWYKEGLHEENPIPRMENQFVPAESMCGVVPDLKKLFSFDEGVSTVAVKTTPEPEFEKEILFEDDEFIEYTDETGKRVKDRKDGLSMPAFLDYPVKSANDFDEYSKRFYPSTAERYHPEWDRLIKSWKNRTNPLQLGGGNFCGFFSILRDLMGLEAALFLFYDDPEFAHRILSFFTDFYINIYKNTLAQTDVDYVLIWEDICYKNGPLISPACFEEFISPCYIRLIDALRSLGVKNFFVDTDGNCESLIPIFMKTGVNGFYPFEVQARMNIEHIREKYPDLIIMGGIDKKALANGKTAIDRELEKVRRMLPKGGYIPYTDHAVPPDVSFDNYSYYCRGLKDIISSAYTN